MNALRILLLPFSLVYGVVVAIRNWLFDIGALATTRVPVPVISVGNISAGGVGKTPMVEFIARQLRDRGKKVAVLSRGYHRATDGYVVVSNGRQRCAEASDSGDEPSLLADKLDGVVVAVDQWRIRAARNVVREFGVERIVLDDGFQHRYLHRELNICIVAADEISAITWLLPAGNRREPYSSLRRADVIVVSRCRNEQSFNDARARLSRWTDKPVVGMRMRSIRLRNAGNGNGLELMEAIGKKAVVFSGIGNPASFEEALRSLSMEISSHHQFRDHHRFSSAEIERIADASKLERADFIVTTEKDVARLKGQQELANNFFTQYPVYALEIESEITWGNELFQSLLAKVA